MADTKPVSPVERAKLAREQMVENLTDIDMALATIRGLTLEDLRTGNAVSALVDAVFLLEAASKRLRQLTGMAVAV